ncbi:hypothetical protein RYA05_01580 [Pseudomonas syringae pv. actinidiae]|nr:hypothetical protein [Pseudomonas syringae pv. actinidiae]
MMNRPTKLAITLNALAKQHDFTGRLPDFLHSIHDNNAYVIEKSTGMNSLGPIGLRLFIGLNKDMVAVVCITPFRFNETGEAINSEPISIDGDFEEASEGFEFFCEEHSDMTEQEIENACSTSLRKLCDLAFQICKEAMRTRPRA